MSAFHPALPSKTMGRYNSPESGFPCMASTKGPSLGRLIRAMRRSATALAGRAGMCSTSAANGEPDDARRSRQNIEQLGFRICFYRQGWKLSNINRRERDLP
ncbi:MAG: hypothetical protein IKO07_00655 [Clostridia bacterium]|nr:hypothetical protein [Clostridia bacterium]